jgi:hypothetical protein
MSTQKTAIGAAILICILVVMYILAETPANTSPTEVPDIFGSKPAALSFSNQDGVQYQGADGTMIQLTLPLPGGITSSDFTVRGTAATVWFQDGGFAIGLLDTSGNVLYESIAQSTGIAAKGYQSFEADMYAPTTFKGDAVLILAKGQEGDLETGSYVVVPIRIDP